jgi:regulator of replication initiation timing
MTEKEVLEGVTKIESLVNERDNLKLENERLVRNLQYIASIMKSYPAYIPDDIKDDIIYYIENIILKN